MARATRPAEPPLRRYPIDRSSTGTPSAPATRGRAPPCRGNAAVPHPVPVGGGPRVRNRPDKRAGAGHLAAAGPGEDPKGWDQRPECRIAKRAEVPAKPVACVRVPLTAVPAEFSDASLITMPFSFAELEAKA